MKMNEIYEAPELEVLNVMVEAGFTVSGYEEGEEGIELVQAAKAAAAAGDITEEAISAHLYTSASPDPDLIVRTANERRLSNFLLWQAAYAELYFTGTLWPDFGPADVDAAIYDFYERTRRYGGVV